jgi:membrane associated rhomboid family serine protease
VSAAAIILTLTLVISVIGFLSPTVLMKAMLRPYEIARGREYATLLTSGFVHGDFGHLLFNLVTYCSFAFIMEKTLGELRLEILYFGALLVSNIGVCIRHRNDPDYRALGASGAITAVLFAAIVYFPTMRLSLFFIPIGVSAPLFAVIYLAYSFFASGRPGSRTGHDAHIIGALTGLAFVLVTAPEQYRGLMTAIGLLEPLITD